MPKLTVEIDTSEYKASHGRNPSRSMRGSWAFDVSLLRSDGAWASEKEVWGETMSTYPQAAKEIAQRFKSEIGGLVLIRLSVLP